MYIFQLFFLFQFVCTTNLFHMVWFYYPHMFCSAAYNRISGKLFFSSSDPFMTPDTFSVCFMSIISFSISFCQWKFSCLTNTLWSLSLFQRNLLFNYKWTCNIYIQFSKKIYEWNQEIEEKTPAHLLPSITIWQLCYWISSLIQLVMFTFAASIITVDPGYQSIENSWVREKMKNFVQIEKTKHFKKHLRLKYIQYICTELNTVPSGKFSTVILVKYT